MAYDEKLAQRIRQAFGTRQDLAERKMFGGLTFLCGVGCAAASWAQT